MDLARATAGQIRRAGFAVQPASTPDDATTGFEALCHHADPVSAAEHAAAKERGDAFPPTDQGETA